MATVTKQVIKGVRDKQNKEAATPRFRELYTVKKADKRQQYAILQRLGEKHAEELRINSTYAEKVFKVKLKEAGIEYEFQKAFNDSKRLYIVDFYLPNRWIIIEVDGGYHNTLEQQERDKERQLWFENNGYYIWRISNKEANEMSIDHLVKYIDQETKRIKEKKSFNKVKRLLDKDDKKRHKRRRRARK